MRETLKYFFDTEFIERGREYPITLLSIGVVCEDGREFYAENSQADHSTANQWVQDNVLPYLGKVEARTPTEIGSQLSQFVVAGRKTPEFWAYYASYDWVVTCQLFGNMIDLPRNWPMYPMDIMNLVNLIGTKPALPPQPADQHNALADAHWNKQAYEQLIQHFRKEPA